MRNLIAFLLALTCCAAAPTTRPVLTNLSYPGTQRLAWANAALTGAGVNESPTDPKPDLAQWRLFAAAVRDNKPLYRAWMQQSVQFWDANTTGFLLDAEIVTSDPKYTLAQRLQYMQSVTLSVKAVAPRPLKIAWYDDESILFQGRTRYPWSAEILNEAFARRELAKRLHGLVDYIVIGSYYGGSAITSAEKWTDFCRESADSACFNRLVHQNTPLAFIMMGHATAWDMPPKREGESRPDYNLRTAPTREQVAELREAVAPYVDAIIVWCGELPPLEEPGAETYRMIDVLLGK